MEGDNQSNVKDLIDMLEVKYGSLRAAARALETDHRTLGYYRKAGSKLIEFIELFSRICRVLNLSQKEAIKIAKKEK